VVAPPPKLWRWLSWPNRITLLRLLLVPPFIVLVMNQNEPGWAWARHAALGVFVLMGLSDAVDGLLARRLNQRSRLGAILDPLADKVLIVCAVVMLAWPHTSVPGAALPNWAVVIVVGKDLWVVLGFVVVYLVTDRFRVQPTLAGKVCTMGQLVTVGAVLLAPDLEKAAPVTRGQIALGGGVLLSVLGVWSMISYTRLGLRFVAEEEKPLAEAGPADPLEDSHKQHEQRREQQP